MKHISVRCLNVRGHLGVRTCDIFFFVSLALAGAWLLFNGLLAFLFSLRYVICEVLTPMMSQK